MSIREMPTAGRRFDVKGDLEPDRAPTASHPAPVARPASARSWTFDEIYDAYAPFVFRNACRLGVPRSAAEDVMQEVFLVVHRRLSEFEERTSVRAWLSAILIRVVRAHHHKSRKSRSADGAGPAPDPDGLADARAPDPLESAERDEAVRELYAVLASLSEERREVFVLCELEEMTVPEIARAQQVNLNTAYWRLRTARKEFERCVLRRRAAARTPRP